MGKNSLFNIGKSLFKDLKDKLTEQGKETLLNTKDELIEKGKETILKTTNEKVVELSKGKVNIDHFLNAEVSQSTTNDESQVSKGNNLNKNKDQQVVLQSVPEQANVTVLLHDDDEKYKDGDQFEGQLNKGMQMLATSAARNPAEAAMVLKELVTMAGEVSKFTEVQKTKRKEIEAERDIYVSKINAQKEVMLAYLDKSFDERRGNFEKLFKVVDHALTTNNMQELALGLDSINNLAMSSPFKDLASIESTQRALEDKNHVWDI